MKEKIEFEDKSVFEFPEMWKECAKIKHEMEWKEYLNMVVPIIKKEYKNSIIWTKFGKEEFDNKEITMASHFEKCVYADLRVAIMAKAMEMVCEDKNIKKPPSVISIGKPIKKYTGSKVKKYRNLDECLKDSE